MLGLFQRGPRDSGSLAAELGTEIVARQLPSGRTVPSQCSGVIVDADGRTRRVAAGHKLRLAAGESAWCFHPGPYTGQVAPFAAAPEVGLVVHFAVDSPDPRAEQQRFDLYLASECSGSVALEALVHEVEQALQRELAQGNLELPPCTSLEEWNTFRAGFERLLYTRFGIVVEDCLPIDLGGMRDYGRILLERLDEPLPLEPPPTVIPAHAGTPFCKQAAGTGFSSVQRNGAPASTIQKWLATPDLAGKAAAIEARAADARALRRLFLELPCLMRALRLSALPVSGAQFRALQALLQRLDLACLSAATMPALGLHAPGQALLAAVQERRARHAVLAATALDEAWALLARFDRAEVADAEPLLDELDRIVTNLEFHCGGRRSIHPGDEQ